MSGPRPLLVSSLPARDVRSARRESLEASEAGADLAELRLDRWPAREREAVDRLFPSPIPLVATYRSRREGGEGSSSSVRRGRVLRRLDLLPFWAVDREVARDRPPADPGGPPTIWSRHDGPGTLRDSLAAARGPPRGDRVRFRKFVLPAATGEVLRELSRLRGRPPSLRSTVVHTTGPSGGLLRALGCALGLPAVYASLPERRGREPIEASQIPVDRLRRSFEAGPNGPRFAVLGAAVERSWSPKIFDGWMRSAGDAGLYLSIGVDSRREFGRALDELPRWGFRGLNVTHPWKRDALLRAARSSPMARRCGCANTLTWTRGGWVAENTDVRAVARRLGEIGTAGRWDGGEALVVGTGGAACSALAALDSIDAHAYVLGRDPARARGLARRFGAEVAPRRPNRTASLVLHATTVGQRSAGRLDLPLRRWLGPGTHLLDFVYAAERPELPRLARATHARYEDGSRLLAYQAAEGYAIWFGHPVSDRDLESAARGEG